MARTSRIRLVKTKSPFTRETQVVFFKYFGSGGCKLQRGLGDPASQQALLLRDMSSEKLEILVRLDKSTISSSSSAGSGKSEAQLQTLLFSVR